MVIFHSYVSLPEGMMKQAEHLLFLTLFAHPKNNLPRNGWFNSHYPGITRWEFNIAMEPGTYEQKSPCSISQSAINWQFSTGRTIHQLSSHSWSSTAWIPEFGLKPEEKHRESFDSLPGYWS
jgi:hypothetical protein